jgi:hypothetical protein
MSVDVSDVVWNYFREIIQFGDEVGSFGIPLTEIINNPEGFIKVITALCDAKKIDYRKVVVSGLAYATDDGDPVLELGTLTCGETMQ